MRFRPLTFAIAPSALTSSTAKHHAGQSTFTTRRKNCCRVRG